MKYISVMANTADMAFSIIVHIVVCLKPFFFVFSISLLLSFCLSLSLCRFYSWFNVYCLCSLWIIALLFQCYINDLLVFHNMRSVFAINWQSRTKNLIGRFWWFPIELCHLFDWTIDNIHSHPAAQTGTHAA